MFDILWEVKQSLREPDRFEHIRSSATAVDENGVQRILIEFRARNGIGWMSIGKAVANVQVKGCKLINWRIIEGQYLAAPGLAKAQYPKHRAGDAASDTRIGSDHQK